METKLSIIIAICDADNDTKRIKETVDSALSQKDAKTEILVCADVVSEKVKAFLSEYEKNEKQYIRLLDGKNACPPNDVGGISGYKEMLNVIKEDPDSDEAWEYYMWLGSKWDEKCFPAIDTAIALNELNHL